MFPSYLCRNDAEKQVYGQRVLDLRRGISHWGAVVGGRRRVAAGYSRQAVPVREYSYRWQAYSTPDGVLVLVYARIRCTVQ